MRTCTEYIQTCIAGKPGEKEVEVLYHFSPASGDGFHEQHFPARVEINAVRCGRLDLLPVLDADQVAALERSILREVEEASEQVYQGEAA